MRMVAGIINMGTPAQKQYFEKEVQGWIDDFDTPVAPGPAAGAARYRQLNAAAARRDLPFYSMQNKISHA